jgi:hypothetical protein
MKMVLLTIVSLLSIHSAQAAVATGNCVLSEVDPGTNARVVHANVELRPENEEHFFVSNDNRFKIALVQGNKFRLDVQVFAGTKRILTAQSSSENGDISDVKVSAQLSGSASEIVLYCRIK